MDEEKVLTPVEQLTEYCDCQNVEERDVLELINLISNYTCWAQKPCETFLLSERKEVLDLPSCVDERNVFVFEPHYYPFDPTSFTFTIVSQGGLDEEYIEIPECSWRYSPVDEVFKVRPGLPECECVCNPCGCPPRFKLLVTYTAGYPNIPDCLLPLFCDMLYWIREKNECDCAKCEDCDKNQYQTEGQIDYTTLSGRMQEHFLTVLTRQYFNQLSLISLCQRYKGELWGIVV